MGVQSKISSIGGSKELKDSLAEFVSKIVGDKKFVFPIADYSFNKRLIDDGILKIESENYEIVDFEFIAYSVFCYYLDLNEYIIKEDFAENVNFLKIVDKDFKFDTFVSGLSAVKDFFWQYVIFESNKNFGCDFVEYLGSLNKDLNDKEVYKFSSAYSTVLHDLVIDFENLYANATRLIFLLQKENDSNGGRVINLNFSALFNGLKKFSEYNYLIGLELLNFALEQEVKNEDLISSVISGLYECKREVFFDSYLTPIINKGDYSNLVFFGLSNVDKLSSSESKLFINLFDEFKYAGELFNPALSLLVSIIKFDNESYFADCFNRIIDSLDSELNAYFILNNTLYIDKCENNKTDIIVKLISKGYFDFERYIKAIGDFFMYIESVDCFERVIIALVEKNPFKPMVKVFASYLFSANKQKLDKLIVKLLMDNIASKRYLGREIFEELSSGKSYRFTLDILSLQPVEQYKLWIGLCQGLNEPERYIPALLPLVNSKNEIVKESFLCKLEEISKDYGGAVLKVLNKNLNENDTNHELVKNRLNKYVEEYYDGNVNLKYSIKEFNPYHTSNKNIRLFNKLHFKNMSQSMQEGAERNSIFGQLGIGTVQLAKGGGWTFGEKKDISKLGSVRSSYSLPRGYFIYPDEFELHKDSEIKADWSQEDFNEIEKFL